MRNRPAVAVGALLVFLAVALPWQIFRKDEPVYQGKAVGDWLKDMDYGGGRRYLAAAEALRHIGTNAIPSIDYYLNYHEPIWHRCLAQLMIRTRLFPVPDSQTDWRQRAARAAGELGLQALPTLPALAHAGRDPNASEAVVLTLSHMLPRSIGVMTNLLATGNSEVRVTAARCLRGSFRDPETFWAAFVAMTNALYDTNGSVQEAAFNSLCGPGLQFKLALPVLVQVCTNSSSPVTLRWQSEAVEQLLRDRKSIDR
jgi:hypothetical protein